MTNRTMLYLSAFCATIAVVFAVTLIFYDGRANINAYGEGWFEVLLAGGLAVAGLRKVKA